MFHNVLGVDVASFDDVLFAMVSKPFKDEFRPLESVVVVGLHELIMDSIRDWNGTFTEDTFSKL